ncbi:MAG TPA: nitrate reductase cytochrome c-type subunit [Thiobacillaceae bacterium]|nr:nitrate reductase cytochrome c-type subunit [Thiobacillaceae bacterium]
MKLKIALFAAAACATVGLLNADPVVIIDDSLGLAQVSVYDVPVPQVFEYPTTDPKESGVLPRYWEDAPPQVPHRIDKFLPVNAKLNKCLECHEEPDKIGKKVKGKPTPMSETHYVKEGDGLVVANKRYVCTLCHAPQANVNVLVDNTFKGD